MTTTSGLLRLGAAFALALVAALALAWSGAAAQDTPPDPGANVNCDGVRDVIDALFITQFDVGIRTNTGACPLSDPANQLNIDGADLNADGTVDVVDALLIAQCDVGIIGPFCNPTPTPTPSPTPTPTATPSPTPTPPPGDQPGPIVSVKTGLCLDVEGSAAAAGTGIIYWPCSSPLANNQAWLGIEVEPAVFEFRVQHTNMCLSIDGDADGASAVQWPCEATAAQRFTLQGSAIRATHSGLCLDGKASAQGGEIIQKPCDDSLSQNYLVNAGVVPVSDRAEIGFWGPVVSTPLVAVAGSNLPDGRILMWSAYAVDNFGGNRGLTQTAIFDPTTALSTQREVSNTGHDMFCPGIANLADGRILVNGGSSTAETSIYDPVSDSWIDGEDMNIGRGYQGTTLLSSGDAFTLGGSWSGGEGGKIAEVWNEDDGWRELPNVSPDPMLTSDTRGIFRSDNHMWLFAWEDGSVFQAGPSRTMHWIDTNGSGTVTSAGPRGNDGDAMNGTATMYEPGKILTVGGALDYNLGQGTGNAHVIELAAAGDAQAREVSGLAHRRGLHHSVVLPSGEVLIVGGQTVTRLFTDDQPTLIPELFDPATESFSDMAAMDVPRTYHSIGLLLNDGRVLVGGGGLCGDCNTNHFDVQIWSPPYLFDNAGQPAAQPQILSAPTTTTWNSVMSIATDVEISEFAMVRLASSTHSVNNDQRRVPLSFSGANGSYSVNAPSSSGAAPPGAYMLFALDGQGVPSVAATVILG